MLGTCFHSWNAPAQLINFALVHLPTMYAVPGQHDLPWHSYKDIHKSAFWTLVEAKKIIPIEPDNPIDLPTIRLHGFPFGKTIKPLKSRHSLALEVAVIHSYIWTKKTGYPGANPELRLKKYLKKLEGFDIAIFGDNHSGFLCKSTEPKVLNCGALIRLRIKERNYQPTIGIIYGDGTLARHKLKVDTDIFSDSKLIAKQLAGENGNNKVKEFIEHLEMLGDISINFYETVKLALEQEKVSLPVKRIVLASLEK